MGTEQRTTRWRARTYQILRRLVLLENNWPAAFIRITRLSNMHASVDSVSGAVQPGAILREIKRCPHCGVANPHCYRVWAESVHELGNRAWATYRCTSCDSILTVLTAWVPDEFVVLDSYPAAKEAHADIPNIARSFLQQAYETLHAPDAAAVMAGSAVDAMLKEKGYVEGSLYSRIDSALADNVLTKGMADWAHAVRLGSNRPRHADADNPHVSSEDAKQSVEFAEALGSFLFVLTKRVERGLEAAAK